MTNEVRTNAMNEALIALNFDANPCCMKARVGKKDCFLYKTSTIDDNGLSVWVEIDLTVKSNDATKTREGFNAQNAIDEFTLHAEEVKVKADKPKKVKGGDPEAARRKEVRMAVIRAWAKTAQVDTEYTAAQVFEALNDETLFPTPMLVGSTMASLVEEGVFDMEVREKKKYYTVR